MGVPMRVNGFIHRRIRTPKKGVVKVQLGPGQFTYFNGWVNVDANIFTAKIDVWADFRNALPFPDKSVDVFYSHHVIEHLADASLPFHFGEMFRCLKPGGFIRVGGPNGDNAIRKYLTGDSKWFPDFPDNRASVGGRLVNFIICRGEHLTILTPSYLEEIATAQGFTNIRVCAPCRETYHPQIIDQTVLSNEIEGDRDFPHTLMIEADKLK
jgi:predicted SAM-dependent methyltransferase